jgi:hypothetical protein
MFEIVPDCMHEAVRAKSVSLANYVYLAWLTTPFWPLQYPAFFPKAYDFQDGLMLGAVNSTLSKFINNFLRQNRLRYPFAVAAYPLSLAQRGISPFFISFDLFLLSAAIAAGNLSSPLHNLAANGFRDPQIRINLAQSMIRLRATAKHHPGASNRGRS